MAPMPDLARIWLLPRASTQSARGAEGQSIFELGAPISASYQLAFDGARYVSAKLASMSGEATAASNSNTSPEHSAENEQSLHAALDALARRHAGEQLVLVIDPTVLPPILQRVLGVDAGAIRAEFVNVVIDWPASVDRRLRSAFIGLDLDWSPPAPAAVVARFPGGPGSAASNRS